MGDEVLFRYYRTVSEAVEIGIAMWSHAGKGGPENPPPLRLIFEDFTEDLYGS